MDTIVCTNMSVLLVKPIVHVDDLRARTRADYYAKQGNCGKGKGEKGGGSWKERRKSRNDR